MNELNRPVELTREAIKSFRQAKGLTQQELANILGVGISSVIRWEQGPTRPTGTTAAVLGTMIAAHFSQGTTLFAASPLSVLNAPQPIQSAYRIYRFLKDIFEEKDT
jgi:transcriptional regulator with XRE-family HTH domain